MPSVVDPGVLAAASAPAFLPSLVAAVIAGAAIAYVCQRIGLVPIVGFLVAGVVIGPNALGVVTDQGTVSAAAEIGVILLLFSIGIEFSLARLAAIRRLILVGGTLQVGLAIGLTTAILLALGVAWEAAVFTGMLVSLSSTAIVLKLLSARGEMRAPHGQAALGLLLFQDLAIVAMVLVVPMLGTGGGSLLDLGDAVVRGVLVVAVVIVVARRLMPPVLELVARACSAEVFLAAVVAICFGTAYLTSLAGVSVSLGAFLAGLMVSESRFSEHAFGEIKPLEIIFSGTFFVSVGMLLDPGFLLDEPLLVLAAVAGILLVKAATGAVAVRALGRTAGTAAFTGLLLAQIGEFSFVLEQVGRSAGLSPGGQGAEGVQAFIAATVLLMAATPLLALAGR
ncbi:MAG TPA: cation:proton antiporter, partial [Miltoncostaeaceae bacterium]|nr:cation:proton antiporter [Miltoncostaeaceae bacterium]